MPQEKITMTRAELYEKVWTTPMRKLAPEYGLSDVGLAKLCRRHNIPLPGLGHWAKVQFGQKPVRPTLPSSADPRLDVVEILPSEPRQQAEKKESIEYPKIEVPADMEISHPVALGFRRVLSRSKKDQRGLLLASEGTVPLKITPESLPRALRICDVLFSALEQDKCVISWPKPHSTPLEIIVNGEKIHLLISEKLHRKEKPSSECSSRWWKDYDYTSTGELKLTLSSSEFSWISKSWNDRKRQTLEDLMGEIVGECERTGLAVKTCRQERIEAEHRRVEEQKRQAEQAARQAEYDRKAKIVAKFSQDWRESKLIKRFVRALQAATDAADVSPELREDLQKMIDWSRKHADYVDPLTDVNWMIGRFKKPSWYGGL